MLIVVENVGWFALNQLDTIVSAGLRYPMNSYRGVRCKIIVVVVL